MKFTEASYFSETVLDAYVDMMWSYKSELLHVQVLPLRITWI